MPATIAKKPSLCQRKTIEQISTETIHNKENVVLPKLPVPDLHETLKQYLLFVKALTTEQKFEFTKKLVEDFGKKGGIGEKIQKKLIERYAKKENWAGEWWLVDMYLNCRAALPVNSNPGMVLPSQTFEDETSRLRYAAKLTAGIIDFKIILDNRALPVDVARGQLAGQPLCMEQYYRLLNSYRLPGHRTDNLVSFQPPTNAPQHIVVACNNQFFAVDVTIGSYRLTEGDFARQFQRIVQLANTQVLEYVDPVGILTSIERTEWAEARDLLMEDSTNRTSLDSMERCVFVLCLDKAANATVDVEKAHQMLHGAGPGHNSANRWYDKTVQLIISSDGNCGLCYEHSASEGIAVIALIEHLLKYVSIQEKKGFYRSSSMMELPSPKRLLWNINQQSSRIIQDALETAKVTADTLDMEIFRFSEYGKEFIKRQHISPDAYVQVALQATYYKIYGHLVSTYESASTRRFREGRVDNIRAATIQALDFAKNIAEPDETETIQKDARNMQLLLKAIKTQTDLTISAITGYGIDCHLLGLKMMSQEMGLELPEIFSDPSYAKINYFQLSTSQIPTSTDSFMCYGAVVPDGYGVSYNPHTDSIVFCVSSFRSCPSTSSKKFVSVLGESLRAMKSICQEWNKRRSSSLERIEAPSQISLHRRVHIHASSVDNETLRSGAKDTMHIEGKKKIRKVSPRDKKFYRHKSCNLLRPSQPGRDISKCIRAPMPQNAKLSRRYSEISMNVPTGCSVLSSSSSLSISSDLLEVLKQESVEFI